MLKGIDVSSHQGNIQVSTMPVDFVIVKATEGISYVNPYCEPVIRQCTAFGKLWGFYHFGRNNDPKVEAAYFITNCQGYFNRGIPVLDWEDGQSVDWVNSFVREVYTQTGVWPWIYANPWRFNQGAVEPNCARWIAWYPPVIRPSLDYDPGEVPATDGLVACWQYASDGKVDGYEGNLDVDHFFGDKAAWDAYAGRTDQVKVPAKPDTAVLENGDYRVTIERK